MLKIKNEPVTENENNRAARAAHSDYAARPSGDAHPEHDTHSNHTSNPARAVVLLSGGADSSTLLAAAVHARGAECVEALSITYGQTHVREVKSAKSVAAHYGVPLHTLDLTPIFAASNSSLIVGSSQDIPHTEYSEQLKQTHGAPVSTYVPFRNGIFLSAAAAMAQSLGAATLMYGAHADDAAGNAYPDCSKDFVDAMAAAIKLGCGGGLELLAPFVSVNKAEVIALGLKMGVPYELTWSCYEGGEAPCGVCATCRDRRAAFAANGAQDPLEYASR